MKLSYNLQMALYAVALVALVASGSIDAQAAQLLPFAFAGAVVALKSTAITNRDATPTVQNSANLSRGVLREDQGFAVIGNGDSVGSTYRLFECRSNDRVSEIVFWAPDIGTTTAGDVGLYDITENGATGAVVDADFFASAQALNAGPYNNVDLTFEAGAAGGLITNGEKRIWEMLGLTADPNKKYDVVLTLTGAADAAGTALFRMRYVSGN
jgi:hypothetical protein